MHYSLMLILMMTTQTRAATETPSVAQTCVACHGEKGISANEFWPNIAGQKKQYLIKQLQAFRDGHRKDPLMSPVSKDLSDQDIESLAQYFSNLRESP